MVFISCSSSFVLHLSSFLKTQCTSVRDVTFGIFKHTVFEKHLFTKSPNIPFKMSSLMTRLFLFVLVVFYASMTYRSVV